MKFGISTGLFSIPTKIASGKNTSSDLQKYIEGSPARISQKIKQLEEKGIIVRHLDEADKRKWIFSITEKGNDILAKIFPVYEAQIARLFEICDDSTKSDLLSVLLELEDRLR